MDNVNLCITSPGSEYVVFVPVYNNYHMLVNIDLNKYPSVFAAEWLNTYTGEYIDAGEVMGGTRICFTSPVEDMDMVFHLYMKGRYLR